MQQTLIILKVVSVILILWAIFDNQPELGLIGIIFGIIIFFKLISNPNSNKVTYQVKELENNTIFNITDTIGGYSKNDSLYVNMTKLMIDPLDSFAMKCVIIKEIK